MIKVSVLYPNGEGAQFDADYYCDNHIPMVRERLADALKGVTVDTGLAGMDPSAPVPFLALVSLQFESVETFQAAFGAHAAEIMADGPNYTNVEPVIQINQIRL